MMMTLIIVILIMIIIIINNMEDKSHYHSRSIPLGALDLIKKESMNISDE